MLLATFMGGLQVLALGWLLWKVEQGTRACHQYLCGLMHWAHAHGYRVIIVNYVTCACHEGALLGLITQ